MRMLLLTALLLSAQAPGDGAGLGQEPGDDGAAAAAPSLPPGASPAAVRAWERVGAAGRVPGMATEPIRAFRLRANVLTRQGVQTNETYVDYRFLAPHFIRFVLPNKVETGRGPGAGRKAYWLKDGEEVIVLSGREHTEDRELVEDMVAVAQNFMALSDLGRLRLTRLETAQRPPEGLPRLVRAATRKHAWLVLESPDFALTRGTTAGRERPSYRVDLALDPATGLPSVAVVQEASAAEGGRERFPAPPILIQLGDFRPVDGYLVPHRLLVHHAARRPADFAFEDRAGQEIYVTSAELRAPLTEADFTP